MSVPQLHEPVLKSEVIEALSMDLDEDIHELEERLILIEAFVKDIDEDVHNLRK